MDEHHYLPDANRVSVLTATILLAFALTHLIHATTYHVEIPLAGVRLSFGINLNTAIAILAAGLTSTGMNWLLHTHPALQSGETKEHWLLPGLTVFVLGVALSTLPTGLIWWLGFSLVSALLVVTFLAEYIVVDPTDARYPLASATLTAMAFSLFLILAASIRAAEARLFLLIPALFLVAGLASLRTLHLRLNEQWEFNWATGIAIVAAQWGSALHYWPLTPVRYGLVLLGPVYALTTLASSLAEGNPLRRAATEPLVMLGIIWGLAILFR